MKKWMWMLIAVLALAGGVAAVTHLSTRGATVAAEPNGS